MLSVSFDLSSLFDFVLGMEPASLGVVSGLLADGTREPRRAALGTVVLPFLFARSRLLRAEPSVGSELAAVLR